MILTNQDAKEIEDLKTTQENPILAFKICYESLQQQLKQSQGFVASIIFLKG